MQRQQALALMCRLARLVYVKREVAGWSVFVFPQFALWFGGFCVFCNCGNTKIKGLLSHMCFLAFHVYFYSFFRFSLWERKL